ncbi:unnamed protein product [Cyprideis torosa]|uniref:Uncharacterized protein n=1 Tax=Cyprideis torosa TaxID=163714 RepID=A0A7R8WMX5_9CRUS|nr:unnamed protein product [Cyprideis torosa]CAG0899782.1 unnamed protein product [Cyprideis torosa]
MIRTGLIIPSSCHPLLLSSPPLVIPSSCHPLLLSSPPLVIPSSCHPLLLSSPPLVTFPVPSPPLVIPSSCEKVLCFHGPLMYEAKCRKVELRDGKRWEFLIHFIGWKRKWDEWVTEERILKFNDDNLERQRRLTEHHRVHSRSGRKTLAKAIASPRMSPPLGSPSPGSTASGASSAGPSKRGPPTIGSPEAESPGVKRKKARTDPSIETEEEYLSKLEVKIRLPDELKRILVDDWAAIQQQGKLLSLPTKFTVETIFQEFLDAKAKMISGAKFETLKKTTAGIREYFNVMLASQLLYKPERDQYDKLTQKKRPQDQIQMPCGAVTDECLVKSDVEG